MELTAPEGEVRILPLLGPVTASESMVEAVRAGLIAAADPGVNYSLYGALVDPDNVAKLLSTTPTEVYNEQRTLSNRGRKRRRVNVDAARKRRLVRAQADAAAAARCRERRVRRQAARREIYNNEQPTATAEAAAERSFLGASFLLRTLSLASLLLGLPVLLW